MKVSVVALLLVAGCRRPPAPPDAAPPVDAAPAQVDAAPLPGAEANHADPLGPREDASVTRESAVDGGSAGSTLCRLAYGPAEQPFRGPAAMHASPTELLLVANDSGRPRTYSVPMGPPPTTVPRPPRKPATFTGMRWPPCELGGAVVYCQGPGGVITRTTLGGSDTKNVAKSRSGTRIAAAPLRGGHSVVAGLETRHTTEGDMLQAFVTLDDREPVRLSDEGAGATTLRMFAPGPEGIAVYVDARTAMAPVHARTIDVSPKGDLVLGEDHVVTVGGPPERGLDFGLAYSRSRLYALLPMPHESMEFGMAAVEIHDPPHDDVNVTWSLYPNGLDPAPIAGTTELDGDKQAWVVRARPKDASAGAPRVLEIGTLDETGTFASLGTFAEGVHVTDVAVVTDGFKSLWILYGDTRATFLERRVCPSR